MVGLSPASGLAMPTGGVPGDELIVAVQQLTHQDGLDQAVFPDALCQFL